MKASLNGGIREKVRYEERKMNQRISWKRAKAKRTR